MSEIILTNVSLAFGERALFKAINFSLGKGQKTALTGSNGSGKTTLMKLINGFIRPDSGEVWVKKGSRVSYLPQSGLTYQGESLYASAEQAFADKQAMLAELETLGHKLAGLPPEAPDLPALLEQHHDMQEKILDSGYYEREAVIHKVLTGLGFRISDFNKDCSAFSGGWQMRIALARVLLEKPDVMLLDEPTNYLDLEAREWLKNFLNDYKGSVLLVSHDRYFLDATIQATAEIFSGQLNIYRGNFSQYKAHREQELTTLLATYEQQQEEVAKIEAFIRRFRYQASKASLVQSRIRYLEKLERIEIPPGFRKIHFAFPPAPHSGRVAIRLTDVAKTYGTQPVFSGVNLEVNRGERLALTGFNGAGKSTLMRLMSGEEAADAGMIEYAQGTAIGYFSQDKLEQMDGNQSIIDDLEAATSTDQYPMLRNVLGAFLFQGDDIYKSLSVLSGGEKSRLALLKLLFKPINLLFLDEPTNHLDMISKDVLLDALKQYQGTLVFVSHDRYFLEALATKIYELDNGNATLYPGDYAYYMWKKEQTTSAVTGDKQGTGPQTTEVSVTGNTSENQLVREKNKQLKSKLKKLEREEEELIARVEELENRKSSFEHEMGKEETYLDGNRIKALKIRIEQNEENIKEASRQWEILAGEIAGLRQQLNNQNA